MDENKVEANNEGQYVLAGFLTQPLDDLIKSLIILRDNLPQNSPDDAAGFEEWRQSIKGKLIDAGITIDELSKVTPPGEIVSLTPSGEIEFYIDSEEEPAEKTLQDLSYGLLFKWILSDEPAPQKIEAIEELIPQLKSISLKKHTMPNNKLTNEMQRGIIGDGPQELIVSSRATRGKPAEITAYTIVTYEGEDGLVKSTKSLTEYDRQVGDTLASLWLYGDPNHIITPEIVYRNLTQRTQSETPSPQQIGAVTRSIEKMRRVHVYVDATEEMKRRGIISDGQQVIFDDFIISLRAMTVRSSGRTLKAYKMQSEPVLLSYSKMTKQLITTSADLLDIKRVDKHGNITTASIPNTENRIAVKGYLLRRIEVIRNDIAKTAEKQRKENARAKRAGETPKKIKQEQEPTILFDTLFAETGITKKDAQTDTRKYVFEVLDFYKAKGRIKAYKKRTKGRAVTAVTIEI